jgi:hypothetical protein
MMNYVSTFGTGAGGIRSNNATVTIRVSRNPLYRTLIRHPLVVADTYLEHVRMFWGISSLTTFPDYTVDVPGAGHYALFRYTADAIPGGPNPLLGNAYDCMTRSGAGLPTIEATTFFASVDALTLLEISLSPTQAIFSINGVIVKTILTTLPDATQLVFHLMAVHAKGVPLGTTPKNIRAAFSYLESDYRP